MSISDALSFIKEAFPNSFWNDLLAYCIVFVVIFKYLFNLIVRIVGKTRGSKEFINSYILKRKNNLIEDIESEHISKPNKKLFKKLLNFEMFKSNTGIRSPKLQEPVMAFLKMNGDQFSADDLANIQSYLRVTDDKKLYVEITRSDEVDRISNLFMLFLFMLIIVSLLFAILVNPQIPFSNVAILFIGVVLLIWAGNKIPAKQISQFRLANRFQKKFPLEELNEETEDETYVKN